jgi:hypothetical protein
VVVPLTATDRRIHITVSPAFLAKVEQASLALSHSMPAATDEAVLSAGLDLLLAQDSKKRALVARPRGAHTPAAPAGDSARIPAHVRREDWKRDKGSGMKLHRSAEPRVCDPRFRPQRVSELSRERPSEPRPSTSPPAAP